MFSTPSKLWWIGATFVVILFAGVLGACGGDDDADTTVASTTTTTTAAVTTTTAAVTTTTAAVTTSPPAVVEEFLGLHSSGQIVASLELVTPVVADRERDFFGGNEVWNKRAEQTEPCQEISPNRFQCVMLDYDDFHAAGGLSPFENHRTFAVNEAGVISDVTDSLVDFPAISGFNVQFASWLREAHPEQAAQMSLPPSDTFNAESAEIALQYVDEFVAQSDEYPVSGDDADPASTIEAYVVEYNAGDIDGVMALFSEESVVTGHPFDASSTGLTEIRAVQVQDIAAAASENAYTISNVEVTGTTVTWDHLWINSGGAEFCQVGQSAVVEEGIILSWTWPVGDRRSGSVNFDCP